MRDIVESIDNLESNLESKKNRLADIKESIENGKNLIYQIEREAYDD